MVDCCNVREIDIKEALEKVLVIDDIDAISRVKYVHHPFQDLEIHHTRGGIRR